MAVRGVVSPPYAAESANPPPGRSRCAGYKTPDGGPTPDTMGYLTSGPIHASLRAMYIGPGQISPDTGGWPGEECLRAGTAYGNPSRRVDPAAPARPAEDPAKGTGAEARAYGTAARRGRRGRGSRELPSRIRPGGHRSPPGGERGLAEGTGPSLPYPPREAAWQAHARARPAGRCDTPFHPRPRRTCLRIRERADGGHGPPHRPGPGRRPHDHGEPGLRFPPPRPA